MWVKNKNRGFTIVELLIVIVVIAILAAITIVAYNGVQNRANDTAIQSDLANIAKKVKLYNAEFGAYPAGTAQLASLGLKISKSSYGNHLFNGTGYYNLVYCRVPAVNPTQFAIIAFSKSGKNYQYNSSGQLIEYPGAPAGSATVCAAAGVTLPTASEREWFYDNGSWQSFAGS